MANILEANDISVHFGGIKAVQHLSFSIGDNEILGLIGPNGSGKSTTVNLITGVYPLTTGSITFDGKLLTEKDDVVKRSRLGMGRTFQTPRPFGNYSVYDNIFSVALSRNSFEEAREKTEEVLKFMELDSLRDFQSSKLSIENVSGWICPAYWCLSRSLS